MSDDPLRPVGLNLRTAIETLAEWNDQDGDLPTVEDISGLASILDEANRDDFAEVIKA
jgi:hypothetical protein